MFSSSEWREERKGEREGKTAPDSFMKMKNPPNEQKAEELQMQDCHGHLERNDFSCRFRKVSIKICRKDVFVLVFLRHSLLFAWISSRRWMSCFMASIHQPACRDFITHVTSYFKILMELVERKLFPNSFTGLCKINPTLMWAQIRFE